MRILIQRAKIKMIDLNKQEICVLSNYLKRNLRYFFENNSERQFWNDAYNIDELETILKKLENAKIHI